MSESAATKKNEQQAAAAELEEAWHVVGVEETAGKLEVDPDSGLGEDKVEARLERYGPNRLREAKSVPWWQVLAAQFKSLVVLLLVIASGISFVMHETLEGLSIVVVILLNAGIGFFTEFKAARAMEALQKLGGREAVVVRDGQRRTIPATDVVPGDVLVLQEGEAVTGDARVIESAELQVDEAPLTGESLPVTKSVDALEDEDTSLADRVNMVYKGTNVVSGNGRALVVGTGMETEIGRVSELVGEAEDETTPLEKRLAQMGRRLIFACLIVAVIVAVAGILQGTDLGMMLRASIALAVAAVPEGLPAVATITLAVGMRRMAKRNALIRRLPAVETLGSATCVCTDKTGTLTRNEMMVSHAWVWDADFRVTGSGYKPDGEFKLDDETVDPARDSRLFALLRVGSLCNNAALEKDESGEWDATGDPTEAALVVAAGKADISADDLRAEHEELKEFAFSSKIMMMGTVNDDLAEDLQDGDGIVLSVKGSPEVVAERCTSLLTEDGVQSLEDSHVERLKEVNERLAERGLRMIGLAFKPVESVPEEPDDAYSELTWIGLVGIVDPPRDEVRQTVDQLNTAGIKTVMITGDQPATAKSIAVDLHIAPEDWPVITGRELEELGEEGLADKLDQCEVFARVSPEQKVDILEALQHRGEIVAMLGDGVNDAVALKRADIGVAMGIKGTDVAKETSDMLLLDDRFVSVGAAVHQGRIIYANIKKFIHYLFSCNLSEILTMLFASLLGEPLPLLPLQILWLNMITDIFPALALAMEPGEADIMERPPRPPDASLLDRKTVTSIGGYGLLITFATLTAFMIGRVLHGEPPEDGVDPAITMSFLTIALAQLFHVFNSRKEHGPMRGREWLSNRFVLGALVLTIALQFAAVYMPGLQTVLHTRPPTSLDWLIIVGCSLIPLTVGQALRWWKGNGQPPAAEQSGS